MFQHKLIEQAKLVRQHVVLPEGEEPRILRAAAKLLQQNVVDLTILGMYMCVCACICTFMCVCVSRSCNMHVYMCVNICARLCDCMSCMTRR